VFPSVEQLAHQHPVGCELNEAPSAASPASSLSPAGIRIGEFSCGKLLFYRSPIFPARDTARVFSAREEKEDGKFQEQSSA